MRPILRRLCATAALLAASCAPAGLETLYIPYTAGPDFGYADEALGGGRYRVSYTAPERTGFSFEGAYGRRARDEQLARAYDLAMLRAAEIAIGQGRPAFSVVDRVNDVLFDRWYEPYYGPYFPYHRYAYPGWRGYPDYWGFPFGGPWYDGSRASIAVKVTLTVELLDALAEGAFDARIVRDRVRTVYGPLGG